MRRRRATIILLTCLMGCYQSVVNSGAAEDASAGGNDPARDTGLKDTAVPTDEIETETADSAIDGGHADTCSTEESTDTDPPSCNAFTAAGGSAGGSHSCALTLEGRVICFGADGFGQATPPEGTFRQVDAGKDHNCGVTTDGALVCRGEGFHGQSTPPAGEFVSVFAGGQHTCAIRSDAVLVCFGSDEFGQITPPVAAAGH